MHERTRWVRRSQGALGALVLGATFLAAPVWAEQPEVSLPWARSPGRVPVGAYATYEIRADDALVSTMRVAVVGQRKDRSIVEIEIDDSARDDDPPVRFRLEVAPDDPTAAPKAMLVQVAENVPMRVGSPTISPMPNFAKPGPDVRMTEEVVTVSAGRFSTKHVRSTASDGRVWDAWVDDGAGPLGLVRVEGRLPRPEGDVVLVLSLRAKGKGARPSVFGAAAPYDDGLFMQQIAVSAPATGQSTR